MSDETDDSQPTVDPEDVVDAATPDGVERAQRKSRRKQKRSDTLWQAFLSDPSGREQLWSELERLGTFETRYGVSPNGAQNRYQTFFNLGQRDYGLRIHRSLMVIDGEKVLLMHRENDPAFKKAK